MQSFERNLADYTQNYLNADYMQFENVLVFMRRKKVLEILNQYRPKNILEIGAGTQSLFDFYHDFESFTVVEPSLEFFKNIQQSSFYNPQKITLIHDFLEKQIEKLKTKSFDCIILSSLLHEIPEPIEFLKLVHSLCNPNTILHVNVPNNQSLHLLWAVEAGLLPKVGDLTPTAQKMQQFQTFNLKTLTITLDSAGFAPIRGGGGKLFSQTLQPSQNAAVARRKNHRRSAFERPLFLNALFPRKRRGSLCELHHQTITDFQKNKRLTVDFHG